jgi:hypothetical protein
VIVAAANAQGDIVRYFEQGETASYFGSPFAREAATGYYDSGREGRMVASTGKIIAAIAIANTLRDTPQSLYLDTQAPAHGLETCTKGSERQGRPAIVAFACSLNNPLLNRTARVGQARVRKLIDQLGYNMPPVNADGQGTPPSTPPCSAVVASPRCISLPDRLASLIGRGGTPLKPPTLIKSYDYTHVDDGGAGPSVANGKIVPDSILRRGGRGLVRALLEAPLCYRAGGKPTGTLKDLSGWCAARHPGLKLHFAKTGTQVTEDSDATVDAWVTGGLQFANGAAYSYVVVVGTGSAREPWARNLHAAQLAVPLVETLLLDLEAEAKGRAPPGLQPAKSKSPLASTAPEKPRARSAADAPKRNVTAN